MILARIDEVFDGPEVHGRGVHIRVGPDCFLNRQRRKVHALEVHPSHDGEARELAFVFDFIHIYIHTSHNISAAALAEA